MTVHDWSAVKRILAEALEREGSDRATFLDGACDGDSSLRSRVDKLLAIEDDAAAMLDKPPVEAPARIADDEAPGRRIGRYAIVRLIAKGGMGAVYEAVQDRPSRVVALKVVRDGVMSRQALRRFEHESQILARLHHPNIAQVYEAGTHDDGRGAVPFFAMEYVADARSLIEHARAEGLSTRERMALFIKVCGAVHHGHQKGVIHRDLKPSNILVDAAGEPKIIDFGVARATDSDIAVTTMQTDVGQLLGTLQYMSPEQCEADPAALDIRSDVYALGVVLYELLCDKLPYDVSSAPVYEAAKMVRETPPTRPTSIDRSLHGDVETIALKALEKDRTRRYQSAAGLAADLQRCLDHEPIAARPPSLVYQLSLLARRHRAAFTAVAAIAAVLLIATVVSIVFGVNAERRRRDATFEFYIGNLARAAASIEDGALRLARERLDASPADLHGWEWDHLQARTMELRLQATAVHGGPVWSVAFSPDGTRLVSGSDDGRVVIWHTATWSRSAEITYGTGRNGAGCVLFTPDGASIIVAHAWPVYGRMTVWDAATLELTAEWQAPHWARWMAVSPDGSRLALAYHKGTSTDDSIEIRDTMSGELVQRIPGNNLESSAVAFSPDGSRLATSGEGGAAIRLWDPASGELVSTLRDGETAHDDRIWSVAFSPDGSRLASGSWDKTVRVWDVQTGKLIHTLEGHVDGVRGVAFSPDGTRVASGARDETVRLWDVETGTEIARFADHDGLVWCVAFNPKDGAQLVSASHDGTLKAWDLADSSRLLAGEAVPGLRPAASMGRRIATANDRTIQLWDWVTGELLATFRGPQRRIDGVRFSRGGALIASKGGDGRIRFWDARTSAYRAKLPLLTFIIHDFEFSPDGGLIAVASADETVRVFSTASCTLLWEHAAHTHDVTAVAFSPDGTYLASASRDELVKIYDVETQAFVATLRGHANYVKHVIFSPDGRLIASGSDDDTIRIWRTGTWELLHVLQGHSGGVSSLSFSPDSTRLASSSLDRTVRIWHVERGVELMVLRDHADGVIRVLFSDDGSRLLSSTGDDGLIHDSVTPDERLQQQQAAFSARSKAAPYVAELLAKLPHADDVIARIESQKQGPDREAALDLALQAFSRARQPVQLVRHAGFVWSLAFSPDGSRVVSGCADGTIQLQDVGTRSVLATVNAHDADVHCVAFAPDGTRIVSGSRDQMIKVWPADTLEPLLTIPVTGAGVSSLAFSPDGSRIYSSHKKDSSVRAWNAATGAPIARWTAPSPFYVRWLAIDPEGATLALALLSQDGTTAGAVAVLDAATGEVVWLDEADGTPVYGVAFDDDGSRIASVGRAGEIVLSDARTGHRLRTFGPGTGSFWSVAFSPDGTRLVTGSRDTFVRTWDVESGRLIRTLAGHQQSVFPVAWSPGGMHIASASENGTMLLWPGLRMNEGRPEPALVRSSDAD